MNFVYFVDRFFYSESYIIILVEVINGIIWFYNDLGQFCFVNRGLQGENCFGFIFWVLRQSVFLVCIFVLG